MSVKVMTLAELAERRPTETCRVCERLFQPNMMWQFARHVCDACATQIIWDCRGSYIEAAASEPGEKPAYVKAVISAELRSDVFIRDGHRCVKCGSQHVLQVDHIKAERWGGKTVLENLRTLCRRCNTRKGARAA
jgi:hypothetical protein